MAQLPPKSVADLVVYLTPPDYEELGPSPSTVATESLATISNQSSLEFEETKIETTKTDSYLLECLFFNCLSSDI